VRTLDGVDVFLCNNELTADEIGQKLEDIAGTDFNFVVMTNRGVKVYPGGFPETFTTDHWRCRFNISDTNQEPTNKQIRSLLE
ncbi:hypothetical protein, partial [Pseudomonas sp. 2995-1]|uniref:hypothetical protein n=1 Tax=Pseudomonas sp. 2995-1 TaxID=1712679 RepID=UPI001C43EE43